MKEITDSQSLLIGAVDLLNSYSERAETVNDANMMQRAKAVIETVQTKLNDYGKERNI